MMAAAETVYIDISLLIITLESCFYVLYLVFWIKKLRKKWMKYIQEIAIGEKSKMAAKNQ